MKLNVTDYHCMQAYLDKIIHLPEDSSEGDEAGGLIEFLVCAEAYGSGNFSYNDFDACVDTLVTTDGHSTQPVTHLDRQNVRDSARNLHKEELEESEFLRCVEPWIWRKVTPLETRMEV